MIPILQVIIKTEFEKNVAIEKNANTNLTSFKVVSVLESIWPNWTKKEADKQISCFQDKDRFKQKRL